MLLVLFYMVLSQVQYINIHDTYKIYDIYILQYIVYILYIQALALGPATMTVQQQLRRAAVGSVVCHRGYLLFGIIYHIYVICII